MINYRPVDATNPRELQTIATLHLLAPAAWMQGHVVTTEQIEQWTESIKKCASNENCLIEIAESEHGDVVGFHWLEIKKPESGGEDAAHVLSLWVREDFRKRGIAKTLKEHGEEWARAKGAKSIQTTVHSKNSTMFNLNVALGFKPGMIHMKKDL